MKTSIFKLMVIALAFPLSTRAQSNECATATNLPVSANCSAPLAGTTIGATQSLPGCAGTADDDVWYQFTATATSHQVTVNPTSAIDPVVEVFSGACGTLTSLVCRDLGFSGDAEIVNLTGLTVGQVYRLRVYGYDSGTGNGTFTICCTVGAPAPANNNCATATSISVNTSCITTAGTTFGATQSQVGCAGNADDDVWYSFVATNAAQTVTVTPTSSGFDPVFQVFSGTCGSLFSEACIDQTFSDGVETSQIVGLTPGQTYFIRVYDYYQGNNGTFTICVTGTATATPINDNPCQAIQLPAVTSNCNYLEFTTVGATNTATPGAPSACIGGSGAAIGGFSGTTRDVWFAITVPSTGTIFVTPKPNMGGGSITDGVMVLYSGACTSLTQIQCSDDNNFPGSANDGQPFISASGLTPGSTVYLRYFGFGSSTGTFGLCVTTTSNDACFNALYICDLNGYSASTSASFTPDRPCNMHGNNETNAGVDQPNGVNTGGIFGSAGPWGSGSPAFDVNINNNSWIRFTASATTASLIVSVLDCWVGNYPSGGIQMQIFSSTGGCCNFTPVSNFMENSTGFTITANGLTVGNDYYLMVDGFAGDICNYTISAQSGVQFPAIVPVAPICSGQMVTLTAPAGATSYDWAHNGATSQSVSVTPGTTQTYSVDVTGLCGFKQTLSTTVTVNPIPSPPSIANNSALCVGQTLNLTAATVSGATYSWTGPNGFTSSLQNPSISNVTTANAGTYSFTVTVNGCSSSAATTVVTINPIPTPPTASSNSPVCVGNTINLFASNVANATYSWTGPSSFTSNLQNPTRPSAVAGFAGTYSVTVTVNGCTSSPTTTNVVINPLPSAPIASSNAPICSGNTLNLSATTVANATYSWSGPNGFTSTSQNPSIPSATTAATGTYNVTVTVNGCTSSAGTTSVTVNPTPTTPVPTNNGPVCQGSAINLSVSTVSGATYSWSGPNGFTSTLQNPSIASSNATNAGSYNLTITNNGCTSGIGSTTVTVNTAATVDAGSNLASCNGGAVNLSGVIGGSASSATWSGGTGTFGNASSLTSTYTPSPGEVGAGTVTLTLTTNNPAGICPAVSDVVTITISSSPSANFSYATPTFCQNGTDPAPIYGPGASGGSFSSTGGLSLNSTTGIVDLSSSTPGSYTVTNFIAANGSCPSATANTPITIVATPAIPAASNNGLVCENGTINLSTPTIGGATYAWSGPNSFTSSLQNPTINNATGLQAGTYQVTVTVNGCASAAGTTIVNITPNPVVSIVNGASTALCIGDSVLLTASGATTYVWNTSETTSTIEVQPTVMTTYTVTGTTAGCSATDQIDVIINTPSTLNTAPTANFSNCDTPTGSLIGLTVNGVPSFSYLWTDGTGNAVGVNADLINVSAGSYFVAVTDGNGCVANFGPFSVNNAPTPSSPTVSFDNNQPCVDGSATGTASTISGANYTWTGPNNFSAATQSFTLDPITLSATGSYCVTATVDGCPSAPSCGTLTANNVPLLSLTANGNDSTACIDESIQLNVSGASSYIWNGPNGFTSSNAQVVIAGVNINQTGYYVVTGTSGSNCSSSDSILVTIQPLPNISVGSDANQTNTYCEGSSATIFATGGTNYVWSGPNNYSSLADTNLIAPLTSLESGYYSVTVSDMNGCSATDSVFINVSPGDFGGINGDTSLCPKATLQLTAVGGTSYAWSGPANFTSSTQNATVPGISTNQTGYYVVQITNADGCIATDSVLVSIALSAECLTIPELVTPDADGHNDSWDIEGLENYPNAEVSIFNRWGNLVYKVSPYSQPWTGEINEGINIDGKDGKVPFGTYFYLIRLNDEENNEYKGYLELQY